MTCWRQPLFTSHVWLCLLINIALSINLASSHHPQVAMLSMSQFMCAGLIWSARITARAKACWPERPVMHLGWIQCA
ncbi:hypothetical protein F5Y15DRAFT_404029 [Xylariaceae sp. FL0016]|nr:hypothetical protein F5Y15DRAFT_404029 [Xylariaceae sp. FL0016]